MGLHIFGMLGINFLINLKVDIIIGKMVGALGMVPNKYPRDIRCIWGWLFKGPPGAPTIFPLTLRCSPLASGKVSGFRLGCPRLKKKSCQLVIASWGSDCLWGGTGVPVVWNELLVLHGASRHGFSWPHLALVPLTGTTTIKTKLFFA